MQLALELASRREGLITAVTDTETADILERIPGAIGGLTLSLIVSERRPLKALALDGAIPSLAALADGRYRHAKAHYTVRRVRSTVVASTFCEFVCSSAAAPLLAETGNLPGGGA
jgi:hypothetical protein